VTEAFGVGTAATIAPIELIGHDDQDYSLPPVQNWKFSSKVFTELEGIKRGLRPDPFNWIFRS
jgi:branched-chain amino acid aminotransferase